VDRVALEAAHAMTGSDFEDNLQIACAVQAGADAIVTRDAQGFRGAPLPVLAPADLMAQVS
jgi:predicted nucleic acid-binding protein